MFALKISQHYIREKFRRYIYQNGNVVLSKGIGKFQQNSHDLTENIKSATDTLDLFESLSSHDKVMSGDLIMSSLKTLFALQKSGNSSLQATQIAQHPQFEKLCRDLRTVSRSLELNDIIDALKVLSYIGISSESNIIYMLLNMLRQQINEVTLRHIIFLEFLLEKFNKTPIIEALQLTLPMLFQINLSIQIDHENVPELVDLLKFASNHKISEKCVMNIISALTMHGESLKPDEAIEIVWSLCELENYKSFYDKLLLNSFAVLNKNLMKISFIKVDMTIKKILYKYILKFDLFYNEEFLNNAALYAIENDVGFTRALYFLRKFNKINFINIPLLDYIAAKLLEDPKQIADARPLYLFSFITGFSIANYKPKEWNTLIPYILKNPIVDSTKIELPWMKFNLELMSIGCYHRTLLEKVFDDEFLEKHLARDFNVLDYLQLLVLYQSVKILYPQYDGKLPDTRFIDKAIELNLEKHQFPLKTYLEYIFGGTQFVQTKVSTKFGHFIDHVIVFDKGQKLVAINNENDDDDMVLIENLKGVSNNVVAIMCIPQSHYALNIPRLKGIFDLRTQTLRALGIPVAIINIQQWTAMPEEERLQYLKREIEFLI